MHELAHTPAMPVIEGWDFLPEGNMQDHPARRGINAKTFYGEKGELLIGINEVVPVFTSETVTPKLAEKWGKRLGMTIYWLEGMTEEVLEDTAITGTLRGERLYKIHARLAPLKEAAEALHESLKPWMLVDGKFVRRMA